MQQHPGLFVGPSKIDDRGVFTASPIPKGSVIEVCPVIVLSAKDRKTLDKTRLHDYYFKWGKQQNKGALVLGYGSIYNHSPKPNAEARHDMDARTTSFVATHNIHPGEEITIHYQEGDPSPLWFVPMQTSRMSR